MENQSLNETLKQMRKFADQCADAYVNQFIDPDGHKVMNQPVVYYNRTTGGFGWCSSLTPLSENEVAVEQIEQGIYGETGDDPDIARDAISQSIVDTMDYRDLLNKIEPEEDVNF